MINTIKKKHLLWKWIQMKAKMKIKKKEISGAKESVKESRTPVHKLSLFEFLTVPGKKTLTHAEAKEKDWDKSNPVMKKKFEPKLDKQKKPSASKKKGC